MPLFHILMMITFRIQFRQVNDLSRCHFFEFSRWLVVLSHLGNKTTRVLIVMISIKDLSMCDLRKMSKREPDFISKSHKMPYLSQVHAGGVYNYSNTTSNLK